MNSLLESNVFFDISKGSVTLVFTLKGTVWDTTSSFAFQISQ